MSEALSNYHKGKMVILTCYQPGCDNVQLKVKLGHEYHIHDAFKQLGMVGRIIWKSGSQIRGFELGETFGGSGYRQCPNCRALLSSVIIVSNGWPNRPTIIGYDSEPA